MLRVNRGALVAVLLAVSGCGLATEPVVFQDFQWLVVEGANNVVEGIDAAAVGGDVALLGQLKTPNLCFRVNASFDRAGSTLNVHITAQQSDTPNCASTSGGYQYTAAIRGLDAGEYTVRAVHSVPGVADKEFSKSVTVR